MAYKEPAPSTQIVFTRTAITEEYLILPTDELVAVTSGISPPFFSVALPFTTIVPIGKAYVIQDETGTASPSQPIQITVQIPNPTNATIDGETNVTIETAYGSLSLYTNGTNWYTWGGAGS